MPRAFWPFYKNPEAFNFFSVPDTHGLAVLPDEPHILAISFFGGSYRALMPPLMSKPSAVTVMQCARK
jgi:hypothetical protein